MSATRPSVFTKLFGRQPATARRPKPAARTRLGVTALEAREVPSVTLYNSGDLSVIGTDGPDTLTVQSMAIPKVTGGANLILRVTENGRVTDVPRASVTGKIYVAGYGGDDTIRVNASTPAVLNGGAGNDTLTGGGGADELNGGIGNNAYPGAERQDRITDPVLTANRPMGPAVMAKYQALGGAAGVLGQPAENQQSSGRFDWLHFQGGVIVSTDAGAYRVSGPVLAKYEALGGGFGVLGAPTEDQKSGAGMDWCHFEGGVIVSSGYGAFTLSGAVLAKYEALGGGGGFLGAPTEDMHSTGGCDWCHFRKGNEVGVIVSSAAGAFEVHGEILKKYEALGGGFGWLGMPVNKDQFVNPEGWVQSDFQKGSILWRSDAGTHLYFSHQEMKGLIKATEGDGVLDGNEYNFLHGCAADPYTYMPDAVRNLTKKLIDGDAANASTRVGVNPLTPNAAGTTLPNGGKLGAGSPAWVVDLLERKWFEGQDRPYTGGNDGATMYAYKPVQGDLFRAGGPQEADVDQGAVGDCYYLAALGSVALKHPNLIRDMFTDNGDGTYTVRLFHGDQREVDYVTVDRQVPVDGAGRLVYAGNSRAAAAALAAGQNAADNPVWAILAEKAYAQFNQSGWLRQDGTNSFNGLPGSATGGINGGSGADALSQITGTTPRAEGNGGGGFADAVRDYFRDGRTVVLGTPAGNRPLNTLVASHVYILVSASGDAKTFVVDNPWARDNQGGSRFTTLTRQQLLDNFDEIDSIN